MFLRRNLGKIVAGLCLSGVGLLLAGQAEKPVPKAASEPASALGKWVAIVSDGQGMDFRFALMEFSRDGEKVVGRLRGSYEEFDKPKLHAVAIDNSSVSFKLDAENATFSFQGALKGAAIRGEFLQHSGTFPGRLERDDGTLSGDELGPTRSRLGRQFVTLMEEPTVKDFADFAQKNPQSPFAMYALGNAVGLAVDEELPPAEIEKLAKRYLTTAAEWGPRLEMAGRLRVGEIFAEIKPLQDRALPYLEAILASDASDRTRLRATTAKVQVLFGTGKADEGRTLGEKTLQSNPFEPELLLALARSAEDAQDEDRAIDLYGRIAGTPLVEFQVVQMLQRQSPSPLRPSQLPTAKLQKFWKAKHGSLQGVDEFVHEKYEQSIKTARPQPGPAKVKRTGNRVALVELFTGQGCPTCVGADVATMFLEQDYGPEDVVVIRYHEHVAGIDPMANSATEARFDDYGTGKTPTLLVNGEQTGLFGYMQDAGSIYTELTTHVARDLTARSPVTVDVTAKAEGRKIVVNAKAAGAQDLTDARLRVVLAEKAIPFRATNGIRVHEMVARTIATEEKVQDGTLTMSYTIDLDRLREELKEEFDEAIGEAEGPPPPMPLDLTSFRVVAFVQEGVNGQVHQTRAIEVDGKVAAARATAETPEPALR